MLQGPHGINLAGQLLQALPADGWVDVMVLRHEGEEKGTQRHPPPHHSHQRLPLGRGENV